MNKLVAEYFLYEKLMTQDEAQNCYQALQKHPEILKEFLYWVYTGQYISKAKIEGYTAEEIYNLANHLDGIGVFNFMITLADHPENGLEIIADGFKRK